MNFFKIFYFPIEFENELAETIHAKLDVDTTQSQK